MTKEIIELSKNVVLVKGIKRGAVYNLNNGDVYSLNYNAVKIIEDYIYNLKYNPFLETLKNEELFDFNYIKRIYVPKEVELYFKTVWLEITQVCNMRCVHCYEGCDHIATKNPLSLNEWKKIIDDLCHFDIKSVVVIGGEPCLHPNILEILEYLSTKNMVITLFTNAYYIDEKFIDKIKDRNIKVKVSLYGHDDFIHDGVTKVNGSFVRTTNAIKLLKKNDIDVSVAVTLMKENQEYYKEIKKYLNTIGLKKYKFDVIREVVNGTQTIHMPDKFEVVNKAFRNKPNFKVLKNEFDKNIQYNSCWYGKIAISDNGDVYPCVFSRNRIAGNIRKGDFTDIIQNLVDNFWQLPLDKIKTCKLCEYRFACKDCRSISDSNGDLFAKNPRCLYDPIKGVWNELQKK